MLDQFRKIGEYLFREGLVDSHGGTMSLRRDGRIFITRKEAMLANLGDADIIETSLDDGPLEKELTRELLVHRAIYRETGAGAIVQAHPAKALAVSLTDNKIIPQDARGLNTFKSAAIVRVHQPLGSDEAARLLPTFLQNSNVIAVVKGYASYAIGKELEEAYKYTSLLENSCRILVAMRSSGGQKPAPAREKPMERRSAIPPGIGVMDRSRYHKR